MLCTSNYNGIQTVLRFTEVPCLQLLNAEVTGGAATPAGTICFTSFLFNLLGFLKNTNPSRSFLIRIILLFPDQPCDCIFSSRVFLDLKLLGDLMYFDFKQWRACVALYVGTHGRLEQESL